MVDFQQAKRDALARDGTPFALAALTADAEGAQLVVEPEGAIPMKMVGHVTSSYRSATLGRTFALAMLQSGRERLGAMVYAPLNGHIVAATVTEPIFYDKENVRRDS